MIITDEILAAYVDGNLSPDQVEEVRQYLSIHPEEMERMVRFMDKDTIILRKSNHPTVEQVRIGRAFGAACMSPQHDGKNAQAKKKANILDNLDSLYNQIL